MSAVLSDHKTKMKEPSETESHVVSLELADVSETRTASIISVLVQAWGRCKYV
jgi:hypothetical protein